jgi:lysozyme
VTEAADRGSRRRHRAWRYLAAFLAVLLAVAGILWFVWLPRYRPALHPNERYGVDVSHHQGSIDWHRVARAGMSFAYIKATEGGDLLDPAFERNWSGAEEAGLDRGAYHFFTLCSPAQDQAANFLRTVPPEIRVLPPAVDLELEGNCAARPTWTVVEHELGAYLRLVENALGQKAVLYVGQDFDDLYPVGSAFVRPRWVRRFLLRPKGPAWLVWQVDGYARVDGIHGPVDLDVMRQPQ